MPRYIIFDDRYRIRAACVVANGHRYLIRYERATNAQLAIRSLVWACHPELPYSDADHDAFKEALAGRSK